MRLVDALVPPVGGKAERTREFLAALDLQDGDACQPKKSARDSKGELL